MNQLNSFLDNIVLIGTCHGYFDIRFDSILNIFLVSVVHPYAGEADHPSVGHLVTHRHTSASAAGATHDTCGGRVPHYVDEQVGCRIRPSVA